jgi:hypothetical protein
MRVYLDMSILKRLWDDQAVARLADRLFRQARRLAIQGGTRPLLPAAAVSEAIR